jgi:phospholipid/cholesterol/gamma-HCH transport system substrate-binding protein
MSTIKNNRPVIVGIFILLGLAILVVTIFTLGGQKKTFVKSILIHAVFNDVGGLIKGGNIWFSGVKIGTVKSISFYGNSQVEVTMNIDKIVQSHIHRDAKAKIGSDGFIGNKIVIIYGGDSSLPQIEKNEYLSVEKAVNSDAIMETLQANNINLLEITRNFKSISKKIDSGNGILSKILNDPSISAKLENTMKDLQTTASNFKTVSVNGKNVLNDLQKFSVKLNNPNYSLNRIVSDTLMYGKIIGSLSEFEHAVSEVRKFTENLEMASSKLNQKGNIIGTFLNDSTAATSIKITLKNLETSSKKLDDDLEAVQHNIFLRGFFRKKEKANKQ